MAVYERSYKRYDGRFMPQWLRLFVLPRYAYTRVFQSKVFLVYFVLCLLPPTIQAARIYLFHNAQEIFKAFPQAAELFTEFLRVDPEFFNFVMQLQCGFAFFAALFVGPGLVSQDLANNGLPLYLSRPLSRTEYVLGKFSVLGLLLSLITWVPGLGLFFLQSTYAGWGWAFDNLRIAASIFIGSWAWIATISLMALALSAWVKWKPVAGFMMFMVFLGGGAFGLLINLLFRTDWGNLINLGVVIDRIWEGLFGLRASADLPVPAAWFSLFCFFAACIYLLHRKIRAYEVVS
ncbi:MAG: hypothetical protein AAF657_17445 [Acidobacteriota bacterium]